MAAPRASIVVVTSDRPDDLRRCLDALRQHLDAAGPPAAEVLTVHGPHDHVALAMVRRDFPAVRSFVAAQRHIGVQRNLGAQMARGDVLVYLDDDALPRPGWLAELVAAFADSRVVAASGPVFRGDGSIQCKRLAASRIGRLVPLADDAALPRGMAPSFSGCNLAIRRSALFDCGGFDENLPYQPDDMDVCARLFQAAGRRDSAFCYRPGAAVTHASSPGPYRRTLEDRAWFTVARDNVYFSCCHAGLGIGLAGGLALQVPKVWRFGRWLLARKLSPAAFARCVAKHVAGMVAGSAKGILCRPRLPLRPLGTAPPPPPGPRTEPARADAGVPRDRVGVDAAVP